jgi:hypothetical protein
MTIFRYFQGKNRSHGREYQPPYACAHRRYLIPGPPPLCNGLPRWCSTRLSYRGVRRHSICECFSICESEGRASTPRRDKKYRGRDSHDFLIHFEPATFGDFILSGSRILADYESRPRRRSRRNGPSYATPATSTVTGNYVIFCFLRDQHLARSTDPFENLLHTTFQNPLVDEYWPPSAGRQCRFRY